MRGIADAERIRRFMQALAKIERSHRQDLEDAREMVRRGLVDPQRLREYYGAIEPHLYRYPAVDPATFRRSVDDFLQLDPNR